MPTSQRYHEGDKSQAICSNCREIVPTTFRYRDMPFSDGSGIARNMLVSVCDKCQTVVAIPAQSKPDIN
ncbi:hypothetical protein SAMN04487926_14536 [Paraburkholderia steynii]|uniref:Uncharacterized protein n=1 Tax=Paraburkholderia steynii TaxID=1245441 RepID=A0A7Z7FPL7_9BURK|nr:hypothetical protein SAMN04487926_14536 [Paraburkholderia steynii]